MAEKYAAPPARSTYRHGDLKRALLDAAMDLASEGGPDAVVLREATRRTGVVPNAAYRHFSSRQDLLLAVRAAALSALASAMQAELAKVPPGPDAAEHARACLKAVGTGYLHFAQTHTGLFRTAFAAPDSVANGIDQASEGGGGPNPFHLLSSALDRLVQAGVLPAQRRAGAEYLAWSAVHGLAVLIIDGPLHSMNEALIKRSEEQLLDMVERGL